MFQELITSRGPLVIKPCYRLCAFIERVHRVSTVILLRLRVPRLFHTLTTIQTAKSVLVYTLDHEAGT